MYNPHEPVKEIVRILHKHQIPISGIQRVFDLVKIAIEQNSIPYNPDSPNDDDPMNEEVIVSYKTKRACIDCKNYFTHCKDCKYSNLRR